MLTSVISGSDSKLNVSDVNDPRLRCDVDVADDVIVLIDVGDVVDVNVDAVSMATVDAMAEARAASASMIKASVVLCTCTVAHTY